MIVITESGAQITSDFVPRGIAAVEKTIAESGLLQRYGRIKYDQPLLLISGSAEFRGPCRC